MNNDEYIAKQLVNVYLQINQFFFVDCIWVEKNVPKSCVPVAMLAEKLFEKIAGEGIEYTANDNDIITIPFEVIVRMTKDITVINWFEEQKEKE